MDEAGFLSAFAGDADSRIVYADWLEQTGDVDRAAIVRAVDLLARTNRNHADVHARALAVLDLADRILIRPDANAWLAKLGVGRSLAGEIGKLFVSPRTFKVEFRAGALEARFADERAIRRATGTWSQIGPAVRFELLDERYQGTAIGTRVSGRIPRAWSFSVLPRATFDDDDDLREEGA